MGGWGWGCGAADSKECEGLVRFFEGFGFRERSHFWISSLWLIFEPLAAVPIVSIVVPFWGYLLGSLI